MIKFIIGGLDMSDHVESTSISKSPISGGNSFTNIYGKEISDIVAYKESLKIKLNSLSIEQLRNIIAELDKENISVSCNIVSDSETTFTCDSGYNAVMSYAGRTQGSDNIWEIDFTLSRNLKGGDGL